MAKLRTDFVFGVRGLNTVSAAYRSLNNVQKGAYRAGQQMRTMGNQSRVASSQMQRSATSLQAAANSFNSSYKNMSRVLGEMQKKGMGKGAMDFAKQSMTNNPHLIPSFNGGAQPNTSSQSASGIGKFGAIAATLMSAAAAVQLFVIGIRTMINAISWAAQNFDSFANRAGDYARSYARINMVNDGKQSTDDLYKQIFEASQRSRSPMGDLASNFGKMGILSGDAFKSNKDMLRFQELVAKQFKVGGASQAESSNATYQLTQALAANRLQGDEMRSLRENAPLLIDAISKYTGLQGKDLTNAARDAEIDTQTIINSVLSMGQTWEDQFKEIPVVWEDVKTKLINTMQFGLQPLFKQFNTWLNSDETQAAITEVGKLLVQYVPIIVNAFANLFTAVTGSNDVVSGFRNLLQETVEWLNVAINIVNAMAGVVRWTADNWEWFRLVLLGVGVAISMLIFQINPLMGILSLLGVTATVTAGEFAFSAADISSNSSAMAGNVGANAGIAGNSMLNMAGNSANAANAFRGSAAGISQSSADMANNVQKNAGIAGRAMLSIYNAGKALNTAGTTRAPSSMFNNGSNGRLPSLHKDQYTYSNIPWNRNDARWSFEKTSSSVGGGGVAPYKAKGGGGGGGGKPNIGSVDEVKKIGITDEERKYLREIASQKYINQYTTLSPNLKIEIAEVKETADINKIMAEAERMVENSWASSLV